MKGSCLHGSGAILATQQSPSWLIIPRSSIHLVACGAVSAPDMALGHMTLRRDDFPGCPRQTQQRSDAARRLLSMLLEIPHLDIPGKV